MRNAKLAEHFRLYAEYHRHPTNRLTHKIAIPLIVFHVFAMLGWIQLPSPFGLHLTAAHLLFVGTIAWYASLDLGLAVFMACAFALCFPLAAVTPRAVVIGIAIGGWLIQLAGHVVWERRSPAFFTNLLQALIGPLFFAAVATGMWPSNRSSRFA